MSVPVYPSVPPPRKCPVCGREGASPGIRTWLAVSGVMMFVCVGMLLLGVSRLARLTPDVPFAAVVASGLLFVVGLLSASTMIGWYAREWLIDRPRR